MVKIKQSDGSDEEWNPNKLENSLTKAGASNQQAEAIANSVGKQVVDNTSTYQIRLTAVTDLMRVNPEAALKYSKQVSGMR